MGLVRPVQRLHDGLVDLDAFLEPLLICPELSLKVSPHLCIERPHGHSTYYCMFEEAIREPACGEVVQVEEVEAPQGQVDYKG